MVLRAISFGHLRKKKSMAMVMLGIDFTNNVFALHGVKEAGQQYDAVARAAQQERAGTEADVVYWSIPCWMTFFTWPSVH